MRVAAMEARRSCGVMREHMAVVRGLGVGACGGNLLA